MVSPFIGAVSLDPQAIMGTIFGAATWTPDCDIFFYQRLPRVLVAFLVGGALALTGAVFQAILRNPLATPYTLGVTGGGSLGAVVIISVPALNVSWGPISAVQLASLVGSGLVLMLIYWLATGEKGLSVTTLLLAGVTVGIFCGAMIILVRFLANPYELVAMERWLVGGLTVTGYQELSLLFPLWIPGICLLLAHMHTLNHLAFGEQLASGYGVDVESVRRWSFLGGSIATASVVATAGPIGFVGLIVPHAVKMMSGVDHRIVLPASLLLGGAFLTICDTFARTVLAPVELPVGIITSLLGAPFFIHILVRSRS